MATGDDWGAKYESEDLITDNDEVIPDDHEKIDDTTATFDPALIHLEWQLEKKYDGPDSEESEYLDEIRRIKARREYYLKFFERRRAN